MIPPAPPSPPLLSLRDLRVHFPVRGPGFFRRSHGAVRAVDGVTFDIAAGETVGLVGESGCGKSTLGRAILQLYAPRVATQSGQVLYHNTDLVALGRARNAQALLRPLRKDLQIIFQDPYASLNPRMSVGAIVAEPLRVHRLARGAAIMARVAELLDLVGLAPAMMQRYPHEFSGGQRQRIGIARALAVSPRFIVCDEPISALDVSIQAQVLNLLTDLQARRDLTYLFIAHDLGAVKHISDRIAVMYLGTLVELGPAADVYHAPLHPYTQALIAAVPVPDPEDRNRPRLRLAGEIPSPHDPPSGCRFHPRCPYAEPVCKRDAPPLAEVEPGRSVACHLIASGRRFTVRDAP